MAVSRLDTVYRKMVLTKFFIKGWGLPENLIRLLSFRELVANRETCFELVSKNHPITILNEEKWSDCRIIEGKFCSPLALYLPDVIPNEVKDAYFQMILPLKWKSTKHKPICIQLAGTGDHFYWRRRNIMAKPLLKSNIGSILLENPFYGLRKPKDQIRSCLHNVSDIFVMGGCLILECLALLHWCEKLGYGPLGLSGLSMGGHMASLAAGSWPKPIVLVPCLSWSTASAVFTQGVMSDSIDWNLLQEQYLNNNVFYDRIANMLSIINKEFVQVPISSRTNKTDKKETNKTPKLDILQELLNDKISYRNLNLRQNNQDTVIATKINEMKQSALLSPKLAKAFNLMFKAENYTEQFNPVSKKPRDAVHFMRGIMDEFTHLNNFSIPYDTSLITAVCAQADGYVPREGCSSLEEIWPKATIHYIDAGHVSAYILYRKFFRKCIVEAFEKASEKYE